MSEFNKPKRHIPHSISPPSAVVSALNTILRGDPEKPGLGGVCIGLPDEEDVSVLSWGYHQIQMTTLPLNEAIHACKTKLTDQYGELIGLTNKPSTNPNTTTTPVDADPWAAARGDGTASGWGADAGWGAAAAPADDGWGASASIGVSADWGAPPPVVDDSWGAPTQPQAASSGWDTNMSSPSKRSNGGPSSSSGDPDHSNLVLGHIQRPKLRLLEERVEKDLIAEFTKMQFHPVLMKHRRFVMITDIKARHLGEPVNTFVFHGRKGFSDLFLLQIEFSTVHNFLLHPSS